MIKLGTQTQGIMLVTADGSLSPIALLDTDPINPVSRLWSISYWPDNLASAPSVTNATSNPATFIPPAAGEWYVVRLVRTLLVGSETLELPICVPDATGVYALPPPGIPADTDPTKTIVNLNDIAKILGWAGGVRAGVPGMAGAIRKALADASAGAIPASTTNPGTQSIDHFKRTAGQAVNVSEFGAVGNGTTDDSAAINAGSVACAASGQILELTSGVTYAIAAQVAINCHVEAKGATLTTSGALNSGACVAVLVGTSGTNLNGKRMHLPSVIDSTFASPGAWSGSQRVGVELRNLYNCDVHLGLIYGFSIGAYFTGDNNPLGHQINRYWINSIIDNQLGVVLESTGQGWVNENDFYGGDFQLTGNGGSPPYVGTRFIKLINGGGPGGTGGGCNSNFFIKPCLEGDWPEFHVEFIGSAYNQFIHARWETTAVSPKIHSDSGSFPANPNTISQGYQADTIVWTGDALGSQIVGQLLQKIDGGGTQGTIIASNAHGDSDPTFVVMPAVANGWIVDSGSGGSHDPATKYKVAIAANFAKWKDTADTQPRIFIDGLNSSLFFGPGGSTAATSRVGLNAGSTIAGGALEVAGPAAGTILGAGTTFINLGALDGGGNSALQEWIAGGANFMSARLSGTLVAEIFTPTGYYLEIASSQDLDLFASGDINIQPLAAGKIALTGPVEVVSLTASELVASDGSKNLVSFAPTQPGESIQSINGTTWAKVGPTNGGTLPDSNTSFGLGAGHFFVLPAATLTANRTGTLDTTGASTGALITIERLDVTANTYAIVNGGTGGGTLYTFPASTKIRAAFRYDVTGAWTLVSWEAINAA